MLRASEAGRGGALAGLLLRLGVPRAARLLERMRNAPSRTASANALLRASDQRWPASERVLDDPYAARFLRWPLRLLLAWWRWGGPLALPLAALAPGARHLVLARHRVIDDALLAALTDGPTEQVVLLGAGYDTRAWRFAGPLADRPVFEVDHPGTARRKSLVLDGAGAGLPPVRRRVVPVDFESDSLEDALISAGFKPGRPTFWVWEGVALYLSRPAVRDTLSTLSRLGGPGSQLACDFWFFVDRPDPVSTFHRISTAVLHLLGEPVIFALHPEDARPFLANEGWFLDEAIDAAAMVARTAGGRPRRILPSFYVARARRVRDLARPAPLAR